MQLHLENGETDLHGATAVPQQLPRCCLTADVFSGPPTVQMLPPLCFSDTVAPMLHSDCASARSDSRYAPAVWMRYDRACPTSVIRRYRTVLDFEHISATPAEIPPITNELRPHLHLHNGGR